MENLIMHNLRWGKSRKSVEILNNENIKYKTIQYLKEPLSKDFLKTILKYLNVKPSQVLRKNEIEYKENNVKNYLSDDEKIIELIIEFPKIIERPIIVINNKAVIGRPPENIYEVI